MPVALPRIDVRHAFFMAMETAWIATLLAFLDAMVGPAGRPAAAWTLWLYPAAYVYVRLEPRLARRPGPRLAARLLLGAAAGIATVLALLKPAAPGLAAGLAAGDAAAAVAGLAEAGAAPVLLVVCASAFAAARGWLLGPRQLDGDGFMAALQLGLMILLAVAFLGHLAGLPATTAVIGTTIFLALGLYGLWLCRWLDSDIPRRVPGGFGWPVLAAAIVGLVLLAGALWWTQFDRGVIDALLAPVYWLGDALNRLLLYLSQFVPAHRPLGMEAPPPVRPPAAPMAERSFRFTEWTRLIGQVFLVLSLSGLVLMIVLRNLGDLLAWLNRRHRRARGILHDPSSAGLWDDLKEFVAALAAALRRLGSRLAALLRRSGDGDHAEVRAVRHIYGRLLSWAAKHGHPRPIGQTPDEFLPTLVALGPQARAELTLITATYVGVRYGAAIPETDQVAAVRDGWRRIRRMRPARARTPAPAKT